MALGHIESTREARIRIRKAFDWGWGIGDTLSGDWQCEGTDASEWIGGGKHALLAYGALLTLVRPQFRLILNHSFK
jgi:hypothetical protein